MRKPRLRRSFALPAPALPRLPSRRRAPIESRPAVLARLQQAALVVLIMGGDIVRRSNAEAPAQAEFRPTCAGSDTPLKIAEQARHPETY
jgi:hypothetical protein